jgi:hypothetical protein
MILAKHNHEYRTKPYSPIEKNKFKAKKNIKHYLIKES